MMKQSNLEIGIEINHQIQKPESGRADYCALFPALREFLPYFTRLDFVHKTPDP